MLVPFISLFFGVYPLVLNRDFALAATLFYSGSTAITMARAAGVLYGITACAVAAAAKSALLCRFNYTICMTRHAVLLHPFCSSAPSWSMSSPCGFAAPPVICCGLLSPKPCGILVFATACWGALQVCVQYEIRSCVCLTHHAHVMLWSTAHNMLCVRL